MAITKEQSFLQLKFGLAFKKILDTNKKNKASGEAQNYDDSYGKISSTTGLRAASISNVITGKSNLKISTIALLLDALGKSYTEFGQILDGITEVEVGKYKQDLIAASKLNSATAKKTSKIKMPKRLS